MDSFVALLGSVWYLVLVAAISPVMILNANAAVHGQKQNHGWAFVSGAGLVLGAIGLYAALALQARGHRLEQNQPEPFRGRRDACKHLLLEQCVTFPRFVLSGGWWRAWRKRK